MRESFDEFINWKAGIVANYFTFNVVKCCSVKHLFRGTTDEETKFLYVIEECNIKTIGACQLNS